MRSTFAMRGGRAGGTGAHRGADSRALADDTAAGARGCGLLPGPHRGVVRAERGRVRVGAGQEPAAVAAHPQAAAEGEVAVSADGGARSEVQGVPLPDTLQLDAQAPSGGQGRSAAGGPDAGESALRGDEHQRGGAAGAAVVRADVLRTGDMENRIKEQQHLFADRTSRREMRSNQLRLYFSTFAYVLMRIIRGFGLEGTKVAKATSGTIRHTLLKVAGVVRVTVRKVWVAMCSTYVWRDLFATAAARLTALEEGGPVQAEARASPAS